MHRDLRVVGAGLDDEVAVAAHRVDDVAGEVGEVHQRLGASRGEPEPVVEQRRPEADSEGQPVRGDVERLTGVVRRGERGAADGAVTDRAPGGELAGGDGPVLQQRAQPVDVRGGDVERGEVQVRLHRRGDAGLVGAVERHHRLGPAGRAGVAPGAGDGTHGDRGHPGRPDAESTEQTAAADVLAGHRTPQPAAAAASCDSGSPSASTARASSCRCGSATVS